MVNRMASVGGIMDHVAATTYSATNFGATVRLGTSLGQELGTVGADMAASFVGKYLELMLLSPSSSPKK
jgi:CDP-diglyceride synthetase